MRGWRSGEESWRGVERRVERREGRGDEEGSEVERRKTERIWERRAEKSRAGNMRLVRTREAKALLQNNEATWRGERCAWRRSFCGGGWCV